MKKKALGRGLEALIPGKPSAAGDTQRVFQVEINRIVPNRYQPRQFFSDQGLSELAESIQTHGIIQPVLLRGLPHGGYELIAGERRLRAARLLGMQTIPALVREITDESSLETALIENLQREELNPMETAEAYHRLSEEFHLTQEDIARKVGKDRTTVTNTLRLLTLPDTVQKEILTGRLSMGHAKTLFSLPRKEDQLRAATIMIEKGLSVREAESLVRGWAGRKQETKPPAHDKHIRDVEERLQRVLGTKVRIQGGEKRGKIVVDYFSLEDLQRLLEVMGA